MPGTAGHVLVVDDDAFNRLMLGRAVTQQGHRVTVAQSGEEALGLLRSAGAPPFDVVLLDILMPGMDGYAVLEAIKADLSLRHIPVIMISALDEMASVIRCIEQGAADYLPKPFNPALLQARLNASLAAKRLRDLELEYLEQVGCVVDAAQAVEAGAFDPAGLDRVAGREDALGKLARVFQRMAREVRLREQRLRQQLEQLRLDMEEMQRSRAHALAEYLPMDRRQALACGAELPGRATGAALFADISGFTPLTAALAGELGLQRGAEELTRTINQVYTALIDRVHAWRGSVIGFAGDAITVWFDDEPLAGATGGHGGTAPTIANAQVRAVACGLAMQEAMALCSTVTSPGGTRFALAVKIAVVDGGVRRIIAGDPDIQVVEAIAGETLDRLAAAEHAAKPGEVLVQDAVVRRWNGYFAVSEQREDDRGRILAHVTRLISDVPPAPWPELPATGPEGSAAFRPWVLPEVYERTREGGSQFLGELRPVSALFLNFKGIDYDHDEAAGARLDAYIRWVQHVAGRFEGTFDHLTMGDKGSYICIAFGAPRAHADDERRAVAAALELLSPPADLAYVTHMRIGVAAGQALIGAYGGRERRTYGIQGERVNLAARLMVAAAEGDILCDEGIYQAARCYYDFSPLPPIRVKGWAEPVAVYRASASGRDAPPPGVEPVSNRIDRLSPAEQLTLKVASVLGPSFDPAVLAEVFPIDAEKPRLPGHLAVLEVQGLLIRKDQGAGAPQLAFTSAAVHETAYNSMLFMQRRYLHRRAAEWYEKMETGVGPGATSSPPAPYAVLAYHWRRGDEPAKAGEYLEKAAAQARARGALEEAALFLRESLEIDAESAVLSAGYYGAAAGEGAAAGAGAGAGPDYEGAIGYALRRLEKELPAELTYHNLFHTRDDVMPAARRLAEMMAIDMAFGEEERQLLAAGAAYHDIGFILRREGHEQAGAELAAQALPGFGFTTEQVAAVQGMILATRLPQSPRTPLEEILADADLDVLGREDCIPRGLALRAELAAQGQAANDAEWYRGQIRLLRAHRYFTAAARALRDAGKARAIAELEALLEASYAVLNLPQ